MILILGIIVGLLLAIIVFLATGKYQVPIQRTLKQTENKFKEKGEIFIEEDSQKEFENFINNLPSEESIKDNV